MNSNIGFPEVVGVKDHRGLVCKQYRMALRNSISKAVPLDLDNISYIIVAIERTHKTP